MSLLLGDGIHTNLSAPKVGLRWLLLIWVTVCCHEINYIVMCKVEFIQPSNWLYSVPNLLVIQHLVTLYLGGFDVRVVSEIE